MKENKTDFIIIRITKKEKEALKREAGRKFSQFIRRKLGLE